MKKKNPALLTCGIVLIFLQLLVLAGSIKDGEYPLGALSYLSGASLDFVFYRFVYAIGYFLVGIIGTILVFVGMRTKRDSSDSPPTTPTFQADPAVKQDKES